MGMRSLTADFVCAAMGGLAMKYPSLVPFTEADVDDSAC